MVMLEVPDPGAGIVVGLKVTVVPVGVPLAERDTALLNPPAPTVVIADEPCVPCNSVRAAGNADTVRVCCCDVVTVRLTVVCCCMPPPEPVTMIG